MRIRNAAKLLALALAWIGSADLARAFTPTKDERSVHRELSSLIAELHPRLVQNLDPPTRAKLSTLGVKVEISRRLCDLSYSPAQQAVVIGTSAAAMIRAMTDAALLTQHFKQQKALDRYGNYVAEQSAALGGFRSIGEYVTLSASDKARWDGPQMGALRQGLFAMAMAHVLAHEMAHHVLGHRAKTSSLMESRREEGAADQWAIGALVSAGIPPVAGIYALLSAHFTAPYAIIDEDMRTHPVSARRMHRMLIAGLETFEQWFDPGLLRKSASDYRADLELAKTRIQVQFGHLLLRNRIALEPLSSCISDLSQRCVRVCKAGLARSVADCQATCSSGDDRASQVFICSAEASP